MHLTYQKNKTTGVTYVYESVSYWDKEKQQSRSKRKIIGKLDAETGEIIPSPKVQNTKIALADEKITATSKVIGPSIILSEITSEINLDEILKECFPDNYKKIISLAQYLTIKGEALSNIKTWSKSHTHPYNEGITSQRVSELLEGISENQRQSFFKLWKNQILENDYLCYDITSISSYSAVNEYVKRGYNRDNDNLEQINLGMLYGQNSELPVYYKRYPGNVNDVITLKNLIKSAGFLDYSKLHLVMDKGFYSKSNIDGLFKNKEKFTIAVPNHNKWVQELIDNTGENINNFEKYIELDGEYLCVHTALYSWGEKNHRTYAHIYFDEYSAAKYSQKFIRKLHKLKKELEENNINKKNQTQYDKYFIISETPVKGRKVIFNNEAIDKYKNKYAGYFVILTNDIKDSTEAIKVYRNKDVVEKSFDNLKNDLDMKRLRVHTSKAMDGRLFVQFVSLIIMSNLRKRMRESGLDNKYTLRNLLKEMETLTKIKYSGKYGHMYTELTKDHKNILEGLNLKSPT